MRVPEYDVFISYRRAEGAAEARLISAALGAHGVHAFLDVTELKRGHFDETLLKKIAESPNFLIVLTPGALDRCTDPDDWVSREIVQAIKFGRNIVPILMPGFHFPKALPAALGELPRFQGVEYSHTFFDGTVARILESTSIGAAREKRIPRRLAVAVGLVGLLVLAVPLVVWLGNRPKGEPRPRSIENRPSALAPEDPVSWDESLASAPALRELFRGQPAALRAEANTSLFVKLLAVRDRRIEPLRDDDELTSAESYYLELTPATDGYLYVLQVDSLGKLTVLHPQLDTSPWSSGENPVMARTSVRVPSKKIGKNLRLDENIGVEHVYCVLAGLKWPELESAMTAAEAQGGAPVAVASPFGFTQRGVAEFVPANDQTGTGALYEGDKGLIVVGRWFRHVARRNGGS